jgi:hypothetical protein
MPKRCSDADVTDVTDVTDVSDVSCVLMRCPPTHPR